MMKYVILPPISGHTGHRAILNKAEVAKIINILTLPNQPHQNNMTIFAAQNENLCQFEKNCRDICK